VSAGAPQAAILGAPRRREPASGRPAAIAARPPLIRIVTFAALGLYGVLRWSTMLVGEEGRLLALLALAVALAGARPTLARHSRVVAALATAIALVAVFPIAGVPLSWVLHLRIAVTARAIGDGVSTLPQVNVPYAGAGEWVRVVIVLGAGVLLFDAALLLAFAPNEMEDLRRGGAALPLVALVAVPSTALHPRLPYLEGLILFVLLAAFVWGERASRRQPAAAVVICGAALVAAMLAAPALDRHKGWINTQALAASLVPKSVEIFDWTQTYGPISWPRHGHTVLEIKAAQPEYWKAEDLDVFDGQAWTQGVVPGDESTPAPSRGALARWSQTIQITLRGMKTSDVIGAGFSLHPSHVSQPVVPGFSDGTWTTGSALGPGDTYSIRVYTPNPSPAQLNSAGSDYSGLPAGYRTILLGPAGVSGSGAQAQVVFPPFHSRTPVENIVGLPIGSGAAIVEGSPYGAAYRLARGLARRAPTPYAYAVAVERFLATGYAYGEDPPLRRYPLESFLFATKRGYCQQFAGAMALLLRMGGVPARVAVGFTSGRQVPTTNRWLVSDTDAHAWVEAWFPHYGWVRFEPTPPADPALGAHSALPGSGIVGSGTGLKYAQQGIAKTRVGAHPATHGKATRASGPDAGVLVALVALASLALLTLWWLVRATKPLASGEARVAELERALARCRRPVGGGATLAGIESRLSGSAEASGYVRALRLARFAGGHPLPTARQRRALRRQLGLELGPLGALRALWALPPRRPRSRRRARRPPGA
jgi:Transglutaminase-like superfamily